MPIIINGSEIKGIVYNGVVCPMYLNGQLITPSEEHPEPSLNLVSLFNAFTSGLDNRDLKITDENDLELEDVIYDTNITSIGDKFIDTNNNDTLDFSDYGYETGVPYFTNQSDNYYNGYYMNDDNGSVSDTLLSKQYTFEMWFKPCYEYVSENGLLNIRQDEEPYRVSDYTTSNYDYKITISLDDGDINIGNYKVTPKIWNHIALVCDGTNHKLYLNGNLISTVSIESIENIYVEKGYTKPVIYLENTSMAATFAYEIGYQTRIAQVALWNGVKYTENFTPDRKAYKLPT